MDKYCVFISVMHYDEYYSIDKWPQEGDKAIMTPRGSIPGGSVSNASTVFAALGGNAYFYDVLSKSHSNDELLDNLKKHGVNVDHVSRVDDLIDSKCLIISGKEERTILVVLYPKPKLRLTNEQREMFQKADYVYGASGWQYFIENAVEEFNDLKKYDTKLALDCEGEFPDEETKRIAEAASILFFNEFGIEDNRGNMSEDEYIQYLFSKGVENVVVTLGKEGCRVVTPDEDFRIRAYNVIPVDTNGAGDTFNASYLYGLIKGWSCREAAEFATAAAGRAILSMGAQSGAVAEEEVREFMKDHKKYE